jgi:altronate dehydratase large subunit
MNLPLQGYRRSDGRLGTRNHVVVMASVFCANEAVKRIAESVPGTIAVTHPYGCNQLGADFEQTLRTLAGTGSHPNVFATLMVGLGCEQMEASIVTEAIAAGGGVAESLLIQERGGELKTAREGAEIVSGWVSRASAQAKEAGSLADLCVALECGGSDATSGLVSNPVVGLVADRVVHEGGTVILSETLEIMGAEHLLARRAAKPRVAEEIVSMVQSAEALALESGVNLRGAQPTPGNMAGGVTTIEEKSLGCIHKAGTSPVAGTLAYSQSPSSSGLWMMDTSGHDGQSVTGMVAGGAQAVIFTTGRGTPLGSAVAPVIKVTANPRTAEKMDDHIDVDVSGVLEGRDDMETAADSLLEELVSVASGEKTKAELLGHREFLIQRIGPTT